MKNDNINSKAAKAGLWYTFGTILLKGCIFLTLPIFTRLMSTSDFGIYNSYMAYEGILSSILGLGLYGTIKNAKIDFNKDFNEYMSSIILLSIIVLIFFLIIANILSPLLSLFIGMNRFILNVLILHSFGSFLIFLYGSKLNVEFKYKSYIVLTTFNTIGNIIFSILLIIFVFPNQKYLGRIIGAALPLIIISIFIIISIYKINLPKKLKKYWKYALLLGIPLVPHVISQSLLSQLDRIMINNMVGSNEAGMYSYIYTLCTITYVICSSMDNAWSPWTFLKLNLGKTKEVKENSSKYISLFILITIGFVCIIPEVAKIFAPSEYWNGMNLIIPLSLANYFIFLYMLPVGIEYYNKKTIFISIGTISAAVMNIILNIIFIKYFGYFGAAYSTLISYFCLFIFHWIISIKYNIKNIYNSRTIICYSLFLILILLSIYAMNNIPIIGMIYRFFIIFIIIISILKNKNRILKILESEKK